MKLQIEKLPHGSFRFVLTTDDAKKPQTITLREQELLSLMALLDHAIKASSFKFEWSQ